MRLFLSFYTIFVLVFSAQAIEVGEVAPDFTLESLDHGSQSLSDYEGKVVYLFFFGYSCPPCKTHGPIIQTEIANKYSAEDVQVLGLDVWNGGTSGLTSYKGSTGVSFPLLNNAGSVQSLYGVPRQDYTVIVDQNGIVQEVHDNYPSNLDIGNSQDIIDQLLTATAIKNNPEIKPVSFGIKGNYPNPFNPATKIRFDINKTQNIKLQVYNITGQLVSALADDIYNSGSYEITWNGTDQLGNNMASGVYFARLTGQFDTALQRMILIK